MVYTKNLAKHPLTIGLRKSSSWNGNINNGAVVFWDLDQGSWNPDRMSSWFDNIEKIIYEKSKIRDIHHYGALNCKVPGRKNWHNTFSDEYIYNDSLWGMRKACLDVVPCIKQAVDQKLIHAFDDIINNNLNPSLIVVITNDSDFIPLLRKAKINNINNIHIRWRNNMNEKDIKLIEAADLSFLVDKDEGYII
jgi:hypothetical protein